jgi:FlaA1/EpsC-like NDP-sugar epimerase
VHAAALKQCTSACEYNPIEAVLTNVMGARNVIEPALDCNVGAVMALSTDPKRCVPFQSPLWRHQLVAEEGELFTQANAYSGSGRTRFACVRYRQRFGNRARSVVCRLPIGNAPGPDHSYRAAYDAFLDHARRGVRL